MINRGSTSAMRPRVSRTEPRNRVRVRLVIVVVMVSLTGVFLSAFGSGALARLAGVFDGQPGGTGGMSVNPAAALLSFGETSGVNGTVSGGRVTYSISYVDASSTSTSGHFDFSVLTDNCGGLGTGSYISVSFSSENRSPVSSQNLTSGEWTNASAIVPQQGYLQITSNSSLTGDELRVFEEGSTQYVQISGFGFPDQCS